MAEIISQIISSTHPAILAVAAVGTLFLARHVLGFLSVLTDAYLTPGKSVKKYMISPGKTYAVITGASDGIGKEFALQLAKAKFNVVLLARTQSKLEAVADEAKKLGVEAIVVPFDFAKAGKQEYDALEQVLKPLEIGVLVNNVGVNHEFPVSFLDESEQVVLDIVQVNIIAQLKVTRLVAPKLVAQKKGLILNIGSVAGCIPSGLLATYSASKAFLRYWSQALGMELKPHKVHVEHITTYFVTTSMSKIRRPSWTTPTAKNYVKAVLSGAGKALDSAPYPAHAIVMWVLNTFTTVGLRIQYSNDLHISIRKRALKKKEREAKKQ
jgi:17beta-estradiol 17-dehydrogenase / very-long-chain 3-oxoacyl-CoA reductase